jgi:uncharacterized protein with von Willebrand factor type A (vWA) domain
MYTDIAGQIVAFCQYARTLGFSAGVTATLASLEAVRAMPPSDWEALKSVLRATLCSSEEEWRWFDSIFEAFWKGPETPTSREDSRPPIQAERHFWALNDLDPTSSDRDHANAISGASVHERLRKMDFSEVPQSDQAALDQVAQRLLRQASCRLSRRLKIAAARDQVDLRRTMRRSIGSGGDPLYLRYKGRKPRPVRLVILLDVSGSMNLYSLFLLRFAHALQRHFKRTGTFIFSTSLVDITGDLRSPLLTHALKALSQKQAGWSGGTRIGDSLREFSRRHGRRSLSRDTFFIILSDGWDTGEPEALVSELETIKRCVRKLVWLNPLLGLDDYKPVNRGMAAALPYVDVFRPAHCLESLLELECVLR